MGRCIVVQGGGAVQGARYHDEVRGLEHMGKVRGGGQDGVTQGGGHDGTVQGAENTMNVRGARLEGVGQGTEPKGTRKFHSSTSSDNSIYQRGAELTVHEVLTMGM